MRNIYSNALRFSLFSFFLLPLFFFCARAQVIKPDEQIIRAMTAFARKSENKSDILRPRVITKFTAEKKTTFKAVAKSQSVSRSVANLEHKAFDLLNLQRISKGLSPLGWNDEMAKIARYHSENMARGNYFSHRETDGSMVNNRADSFGMHNWKSIGENIAFNRGFKLPAESACEQWMNSSVHRENILDKRWKEAGIGVAVAVNGTYYFTQVFILR